MTNPFAKVDDLNRSYLVLTISAVLLVLSLFVTQAVWTYSDSLALQSLWLWVLGGSLVFHVAFFGLSFQTARRSRFALYSDMIFPIVIAAAADVICLGIDFVSLHCNLGSRATWMVIPPFLILLFEITSVCRKIESHVHEC